MTLLVTGGGGLIGGAVVRLAAAAGWPVVAVGRRRPENLPENVSFVVADLLDTAGAAVVRDVAPTHLIHAAWETCNPTYWNDPSNLDWVIATARMAAAFGAGGGCRFVHVGSCAEYDWTGGWPDARRDGAATRYGKAKLAAFRAIEVAAQNAFAATEARVFWVYGPGENAERFIPLTCRAQAAGQAPALGSGRQERDLLYVDDAAAALYALLRDDAPTGVVDIGAGKGAPLAAVATIIARLAGRSATGLGVRPDRPDDPPSLVADAGPLRTTGWIPHVSLEEGLRRTFAWWRQQEGQAS